MGGDPYWYFFPYGPDLQRALEALRQREFDAGRYAPVIDFLDFDDPGFYEQRPGKRHATVQEARDDAAPDGTRSILDIDRIAEEPDFGVAAPVPNDVLGELYGTVHPTREQVEADMSFLDGIERGQCGYVILYRDGKPSEICFAGYSYD